MGEEMKKILITVDGSDNSRRALIEAKKYANLSDTEITLLTVVKPLISEYYDNIELPKLNDPDELKKAGRSIIVNGKKSLENLRIKLLEKYEEEIQLMKF